MSQGSGEHRGGRLGKLRGLLDSRWRFALAVLLPIGVSVFSQFEFVQSSRCVVARLPWGVGQCEVMADLIAPAWALSIAPVANRLRRLAERYGGPPEDLAGWVAGKLATPRAVERATTLAKAGSVLIVLLAYTREWERFNEQPDAVWYVLLIVATFGLLLIPTWWLREEIHARGVRHMTGGKLPNKIDRFLFAPGRCAAPLAARARLLRHHADRCDHRSRAIRRPGSRHASARRPAGRDRGAAQHLRVRSQ